LVVGVATITLYINGSQTLKDKRRVIKSLLTRLHNRFNVAAAEVGRQDSRQEAEIGVACISTEGSHADQILAAVVDFIEAQGDVHLIEYHTQLL